MQQYLDLSMEWCCDNPHPDLRCCCTALYGGELAADHPGYAYYSVQGFAEYLVQWQSPAYYGYDKTTFSCCVGTP